MRWLYLTSLSRDEKIWVNITSVNTMRVINHIGTGKKETILDFGDSDYLSVEETPEKILSFCSSQTWVTEALIGGKK